MDMIFLKNTTFFDFLLLKTFFIIHVTFRTPRGYVFLPVMLAIDSQALLPCSPLLPDRTLQTSSLSPYTLKIFLKIKIHNLNCDAYPEFTWLKISSLNLHPKFQIQIYNFPVNVSICIPNRPLRLKTIEAHS